MTVERDTTRIVRSWLRTDEHESAEHILHTVLARLDTTPQRRSWWPAWRFLQMNLFAKAAIAAAAVLVVAIVGLRFLPATSVGPGLTASPPVPTPSPTTVPSPTTTASPPKLPAVLPAGTYEFAPFGSGPGLDSICLEPAPSGCVDPGAPTSLLVTLTVPEGWDTGAYGLGVWQEEAKPPRGTALGFNRGGSLHSDPCRRPDTTNPDIPVGPTVDDFVTALTSHPLLDTTAPVDVTVDGYVGKALDLQTPADISQCDVYRAWEPGIYAQGPGHLWHLRVIDVDGVRVVIQSMEYATTPAQRRAELQAIVDSIQIEP
jgi:hypothetical protein